jgi:hypothetical protein
LQWKFSGDEFCKQMHRLVSTIELQLLRIRCTFDDGRISRVKGHESFHLIFGAQSGITFKLAFGSTSIISPIHNAFWTKNMNCVISATSVTAV